MKLDLRMIIGYTLIVMILFAIWSSPVQSHSWYDSDCCGENDCEPVKIEVDSGGNYAILKNGTKWYIINPRSVRPSQDDNYHVCIYQNQVWCLYVPTGI